MVTYMLKSIITSLVSMLMSSATIISVVPHQNLNLYDPNDMTLVNLQLFIYVFAPICGVLYIETIILFIVISVIC